MAITQKALQLFDVQFGSFSSSWVLRFNTNTGNANTWGRSKGSYEGSFTPVQSLIGAICEEFCGRWFQNSKWSQLQICTLRPIQNRMKYHRSNQACCYLNGLFWSTHRNQLLVCEIPNETCVHLKLKAHSQLLWFEYLTNLQIFKILLSSQGSTSSENHLITGMDIWWTMVYSNFPPTYFSLLISFTFECESHPGAVEMYWSIDNFSPCWFW